MNSSEARLPKMNTNAGITKPLRSWRWGPLSLFSWSVVAHLLWALALTLPRLGTGSLPLFQPEEAILGSYPFFAWVYACVPLAIRDGFFLAKGTLAHKREFFLSTIGMLATALVFYVFVFGWY